MSQNSQQAMDALRKLLESHEENIRLKAAELILIYDQKHQGENLG